MPDGTVLTPDYKLRLPDGRIIEVPITFSMKPTGTCYFIRTLKPIPADPDAPTKGFIPLQARVGGVASGPDCTAKGALPVPIPVKGRAASTSDEAPAPSLASQMP